MLSPFPEKLCQVFGELGTKIGTQKIESLWACCLFYCGEGVQTVKQFPLSLWLGLAWVTDSRKLCASQWRPEQLLRNCLGH